MSIRDELEASTWGIAAHKLAENQAAQWVQLGREIAAELEDEIMARANAETALIIALEGQPAIDPRQYPVIERALRNLVCFQGTPMLEKLLTQYGGQNG